MKKYFIPGKDEELKFGERYTLHKVTEDDYSKREVTWKGVFDEEVVPLLLSEDLIEEKEVDEGSDNDIDDYYIFNEATEMIELMSENLQILTDINRTLVDKITGLEEKIDILQRSVTILLKDRKKKEKDEGK